MQRRICVVLESPPAPHSYDLTLLERLLAHAGISLSSCLLTHLLPAYTAHPERVKWTSDEMQAALTALTERLTTYAPQFVILFDRSGILLRAFSGEKRSVDDYRGSLFVANAIAPGVKYLATYSMGRLRIDYGLTAVVKFDLARAAKEAQMDELVLPERRIRICMPDGKGLDLYTQPLQS